MADAESYLPLPHLAFQVLLSLAEQDRHGYAIVKDVAARGDSGSTPSTGSLYLSIARLLENGLVAELAPTEGRRRTYTLTPLGRQVARAEAERLDALVSVARTRELLLQDGERSGAGK